MSIDVNTETKTLPPVAGVVITVAALLQALLWGFGGSPLVAILSGLVTALALAVTASWVAAGSVERFAGPGLALILWSLGSVLVVSTLLVSLPVVTPVVVAILLPLLITVAARRPWRDLALIWRRVPGRTVGWLLLSMLIVIGVWLLGAVLGLVGVGVIWAFGWWVVFGITQFRLLKVWNALPRRV